MRSNFRKLLVYAFAGCAMLAAGCRNDAITSPTSQDGDEALRQLLVQMGFAPTDIRESGDYFVVEGDIRISKAHLRANSETIRARNGLVPQGPQRQYSTGSTVGGPFDFPLWGIPVTANIYVDLSALDAQNPGWAAAFRTALGDWNSIPGTRLVFAEAAAPYANLTVVMSEDCPPNSVACAEFPISDPSCSAALCPIVPGPSIHIVSGFDNLSVSVKRNAAVHEMGHSIGFRHTNWNNRPCPGGGGICTEGAATHIPGTPTSTSGGPESDAESVMQAATHPWYGFTMYDRIAARYLYPGGNGPVANGALVGNNPQVGWNPMNDAVAYEVWFSTVTGGCTYVCFGWEPPAVYTDVLVTTTTSTSVIDYSRTFTRSDYLCGPVTSYRVKTVFPNGSKSNLGSSAVFCSL